MSLKTLDYGTRMRRALDERGAVPFIGVFDAFSATVAASRFDGLFLSGFGFAASHYGLPDIGFIAWSDMVDYARRIRTILPEHHLLVDIDDGYCDVEVACHVTRLLEQAGVSGIVLEDQQRPRKCGHLDGKQIMPLDGYLEKLAKVLEARSDMFVVARTDASDPAEVEKRVRAFSALGPDAILVDGLKSLDTVSDLASTVPQPFAFNQIAGGKSPVATISELESRGVKVVIYSTPCLFSAQKAMAATMDELLRVDGLIPPVGEGDIGVAACNDLLTENLERARRGARQPG